MKFVPITLSILLLMPLSVPVRADFRYTDTSQITGGALMGMANLAAKFSKDSRQALQPVSTTHAVKGNHLRTDNSDGTVQIIDLDGRRIIVIDNQKKTYSVATFEEIKAAVEKAQQNAQQQMQQQQPAAKKQDAQINVKPKFTVLPGSGSRVLLGQNTTETKFKMDMEMQAQNNGPTPSPAPAENSTQADGPNSVTFTMTMDMFVAPSVAGYQEVSEFYKRMAKEVNWVPPASIHVDPRMTQGMAEMQKNSAALKGLPMLSYISMGMPVPPNGAADSTQNSSGTTSRSNSSSSTSSDTIPTNSSDAVVKGLGSLFGKKKQQDNSSSQASSPAPPPNPNSDPNALMEMTMQVTSFSDSSLDAGLFEVPAGYARVQQNPDQILGHPAARQH
jgi:hypothetical protein